MQNLAQFIAIRAALGIGETIDNPASQSLLADYYPTERRGRAYAAQRAAPLVGTAIGTGIGGVVSATLGWRWAFLIVGVPGSVIALLCWRLPEPVRKGSAATTAVGAPPARTPARCCAYARCERSWSAPPSAPAR